MQPQQVVIPFSLKDAPSLIEHIFPAQKISIEAQTERKAGNGQTLTVLGSYWKGRKPLILVRACVLGALLPATNKPRKDLEIFEMLMAMDDETFQHRVKKVTANDVEIYGGALRDELLTEDGKWKIKGERKKQLQGRVLAKMPYSVRLNRRSLRPEELKTSVYNGIWEKVNAHLGTNAYSHLELIEQLGIMRFGQRPTVGDTFCGGGSIPFESARLGCNVYASDLNPIACMLTWGAFHIIGADNKTKQAIEQAQNEVIKSVDKEVTRLGIEHDSEGNRAKAYLYCIETRCPETGWLIPLAPSWVISTDKRCIAKLIPDYDSKKFTIEIVEGVTKEEFLAAKKGTVQRGNVVYELNGTFYRTSIQTLRGDRRVGGASKNNLRQWQQNDFMPQTDDLFQERLYCIQWIDKNTKKSFFREVTEEDLKREQAVVEIVYKNLNAWQEQGLVPEMPILPGDKTDEPIRTRGWTHWHHLFSPRQLHILACYMQEIVRIQNPIARAYMMLVITKAIEWESRLCRWDSSPKHDELKNVFSNQALNTFFNYGSRSALYLQGHTAIFNKCKFSSITTSTTVQAVPVGDLSTHCDIYITDPPYADAINYHEITEFFIAWLRKNPPPAFAKWVWDSRRDLAIKGRGEEFRREMIKAYKVMAENMPDNGLQIVMFTHKDAKVWGDMAGIFWGAGLRVTAAWYIATETTSELKKGGYVQGTVLLVLRKRVVSEKIYKDELVLEIKDEVAQQIQTLVGLNQKLKKHGRSENVFEDADLQMAGYAAALRVLTSYTHIDGKDMTLDALRPRVANELSLVDELIDFSVAIANEYLIPEGMASHVWEHLSGSERFYLRMLDIETAGINKLDNYQNFAKAFKVNDYNPLMAKQQPNNARLKSAMEFKRSEFSGSEFAESMLRAVLYAVYELQMDVETEDVMSHLRDNVMNYYQRRQDIVEVTNYLVLKLNRLRAEEASAARILNGLIRNEQVGS